MAIISLYSGGVQLRQIDMDLFDKKLKYTYEADEDVITIYKNGQAVFVFHGDYIIETSHFLTDAS